jgi:hypothetical protein
MSDLSRREFLKSLSIGGVALFTPAWFKLVAETKSASDGRQLPAKAGEKIKPGWSVINAFWNKHDGRFELCVNGTIYDGPPEYEGFDASSVPEQEEDESDEEYDERVEQEREDWEDEHGTEDDHEQSWYREKCPGARAVPYLHEVFDDLEEKASDSPDEDYEELGGIDFHDGACPGNDTYYAATANDYETLAALQVVLNKLRKRCRVVIVEPNPRDGARA